ncbi:bifunctional tetrahydrofolate synthase/dihydrofolate synthase [Brackiella oedipodis]|uniref:bifunctional tetrahydrofolate synthase/dihydrofolate synthase n=1 Tax=Brackiella oedipodis TaxID=124225 RepID=UPI000688D6A1|nr:bifunctional tetrahydrofolate synthase/dihydrofolate synthase [Brackiella oedipodis]
MDAIDSKPAVPTQTSNLSDWLTYLENLHTQTIDLGLERVQAVADKLGIEWDGVKIIVAGTNGKGSTCAMLESIYTAAGFSTGLYTSPHLNVFNERIKINGELAQDQAIIEQFDRIEKTRGDISLSYFEYTTLAAILLFQKANLDVSIFEVGLGGRLDAVNIIDADCSIVTCIDIDHTAYLGDTREQIALEKAHVYRSHKPAICSDPMPPQSLIDYAQAIEADLWLFGRDFNYSGDKQQWAFAGRTNRRNALAYPALRGANQLLNASAALACIEALNLKLSVPLQAIREGLLLVNLPGRFQILPGQPTVILDVAHNPHAASVLSHNLEHMSFHPYTYAVFGMLNDKDCDSVIQKLSKDVDYWYCVSLQGPRGQSAQALAAKIEQLIEKDDEGLPQVRTFDNSVQAYQQALQDMNQNDRLIVFGSFLTVADVLEHIRQS